MVAIQTVEQGFVLPLGFLERGFEVALVGLHAGVGGGEGVEVVEEGGGGVEVRVWGSVCAWWWWWWGDGVELGVFGDAFCLDGGRVMLWGPQSLL